MAKKKSRKKHQFKHSAPVASSPTRAAEPAVVTREPAKSVPPVAAYEVENLSLIKQDVRKVAVLAAAFVALQAVLWFVFNYTSFGASVYHLIKL